MRRGYGLLLHFYCNGQLINMTFVECWVGKEQGGLKFLIDVLAGTLTGANPIPCTRLSKKYDDPVDLRNAIRGEPGIPQVPADASTRYDVVIAQIIPGEHTI